MLKYSKLVNNETVEALECEYLVLNDHKRWEGERREETGYYP